LEPLIHGGGQERSRRAGTENLLAIASLAAVCPKLNDLPMKMKSISSLRDQMDESIISRIPHVTITASKSPRVCNTSSLVIDGVDG
jgi:cysteine desulfurase